VPAIIEVRVLVGIARGSDVDSLLIQVLLRETASIAPIGNVCADSAYASRANAQLVRDLGGKPFIRPKSNHTPRPRGSPAWKRMVIEARKRPANFRRRYGLRWMSETVNSILKMKWGDSFKSRAFSVQNRELGLRIILYNARESLKMEFLAGSPKVSSTDCPMHPP